MDLDLTEKIGALLEVPLEEVVYEATWILTNLAGGSEKHENSILKSGCVKTLVKLLDKDREKISEQVYFCILLVDVGISEFFRM